MSSTVLVRLPRSEEYQNPALTPFQTRLDGLVSRFTEEATNPQTLAALTGSSLAYRYGRLGFLSLASSQEEWAAPLLRVASYGVGLSLEAGAYEGIQRSIRSLKGDRPNPRLWDWKGSDGIGQGFATSLLTFGLLKGTGYLGRSENLIFQHGLQSGGIVAGHQMAASLGLIPSSQGSLGEQLVEAETTNLQVGSALGLLSAVAPSFSALEKGLDLSIRSKETPFPRFPLVALAEANAGEKILSSDKARSLDPMILMSKGEGEGRGPSLELILGGAYDRSYEQELQDLFWKTASSTSFPRYRRALEVLARLQDKSLKTHDSFVREGLLNASLRELQETLKTELSHLSREDWNILAAGLFSLGTKILSEGPEGGRVGPFCRLVADFVAATQPQPDFENDPQHFFRDRLMSQAMVALKGFLNDRELDGAQKTALAALWVRMGIAKGSVEWAQQGADLPEANDALQELLGITREDVLNSSLMASASYFQMAKPWRGLPLGALEYSLAYYLDHWGRDHREAKAGAFEYSAEHEAVTQLRQELSATPLNQEVRRRMLERMVHLTALHTSNTLPSTPLVTFLNRAMKLPGTGGDGPPNTDPSGGKESTL